LAVSRRPANAPLPAPPVSPGNGLSAKSPDSAEVRPPRKAMSAAERRKVEALQHQIRSHLKGGWTLAAKRLLESDDVKKRFDPFEFDRAQATLANRYFAEGHDEQAYAWASRAAARSGRYLPDAEWIAGLSAWRMGKLDKASGHFEAVALSPNSSEWMIAAGAFWAARSHLVNRKPGEVNRLLGRAAAYPRTFYGLLARRILGMSTAFRWTLPPLEEAAIEAVAATPAGQRALALIEVGEEPRAEQDLRLLVSRSDADLARGIMVLASRAGMPALSIRLNSALSAGGGGFDGAAFPIPRWAPENGFRVDRALLFALIRQESQFNPNAVSWAGARGLMQLMPGTASFVANDRQLRSSKRHRLYDPDINLELGQTYIEILLNEGHIGNDLFHLTAAWNGGPGNLSKWQRRGNGPIDPLLFIESIPSPETRNFIERVLANLWIYRDRLGQPSPSLDALAAGDQPVYVALDPQTINVVQHGQNNR
jgi:soluble lytic murein transglycosylase-like protein